MVVAVFAGVETFCPFGTITAIGYFGIIDKPSLYHITSVTFGGFALKLHVNIASPVSLTIRPSAGCTETDGGSVMKENGRIVS